MVNILRFSSDICLPESVTADLQAAKILPAAALSFLRRPCGASEIPARLELFSLLDAELKDRLSGLLASLREHARTAERLRKADSAHERLYLRLRILENYEKITEKIAALEGKGALLSELAGYYAEKLSDEVGEDLARARAMLEAVNSFYFLDSGKIWVTPASDAPTLNERFTMLSDMLELSLEPSADHPLPLPPSVGDALMNLFPAEFSEIRSVFDKYFMLDPSEPLAHIPELEFILAISDLIDRARLPHCIPEIADAPEFTARGLYDVSLIAKSAQIVPNDAEFSSCERFFFLTGANGGGKTTYARAIGINLLLFLSGCPVFAESARIYPFSTLLTHFPADERFTESGRLDDERRRCERMLAAAGEIPFLIYNETFSGTDEARGYELLCELATEIRSRGAFGLFVTHFHRVSELGIPMLTAEIDGDNENLRTYRIRRTASSRSSFAADILKKYRLDRHSLEERGKEK